MESGGEKDRGISERRGGAKKVPSRAVAVTLALLLPCGTGHQFVGMTRRALGWLGATLACSVAAAFVARAGGFGAVALGLLVLVIVGAWLGPAVDVGLIRAERFTRVPVWKVALYAVVALVVGTLVRTGTREFVVEAFKIPSGAMLPTLHVGDNFFVDKAAYGASGSSPQYGDIIVFEYPDPSPENERQDFVKRVVALGGDTLEVDDGHPVINGWRVPSCYVDRYDVRDNDSTAGGDLFVEFLGDHSYLIWLQDDLNTGRQGPYRVEPGETWVLGDNRNNSSDSRAWLDGSGAGVPDALVKGRASSVWLALDDAGSVNWRRIGTNLNAELWLPANADPSVVAKVRRCLSERPSQTVPPRGAAAVGGARRGSRGDLAPPNEKNETHGRAIDTPASASTTVNSGTSSSASTVGSQGESGPVEVNNLWIWRLWVSLPNKRRSANRAVPAGT